MDGGAAEAALGAWASVRGFFTPATLFLVVNLVIGTIALTSRSRRRGSNAHDVDDPAHGQHQHQAQQHQQHENHQYFDQQHEQQQYVPAPAPLARTSSVLDRLRSIGLYRFRSGDFPPEYATPVGTDSRDATSAPDAHRARSRSEPAREEFRRPAPSSMKKSSSVARRAEVPRAPAARVVWEAVQEDDDDVLHYTREDDDDVLHYTREDDDDVLHYTREDDEFTENSFTAHAQRQAPPAMEHEEEEEEEEENYYREEYVPPLRPTPLTRAPSVLERLRSFGLSRFRSGELGHEQTAAAVDELERNHAQKQETQQFIRSRSEPSREQSKKGKKQKQESAEARMSKSGSVARNKPPAPAVAADVAEGGVDARADDFINTFRKQLQLQRLNSLLNYKEMINRGA